MTTKAGTGLLATRDYFDNLRQYKSIAELECEFFKLLLDKKSELTGLPSVQQALKSAAAFIQDPLGVALSVLVEFEVIDQHRRKRQTMYLGTRLTPKATQSDALVTHCICIAEDGKFLAKIHLDRDFSAKDPTSKPTPHIQTGGRAIPALQKKITGTPFWNDDVDKPRIPSMPFCTALLWHWAFLEYPVERRIAPFLHTGWWPLQIRKTEEALLKPFFDDGVRLLAEKPASGLLRSFYIPLAR